MSLLFLKAMGIGLAVAAPVGPMSLLCMRRTLTDGWRPGLATGAGIALGDGVYAAVAALGFAGVSAFMLEYEKPLHLAAGLFLIWLGLRSFWRKADAQAAPGLHAAWPKALGSALLLTLTNPPTIIMFVAIFAALAPKTGFSPSAAATTTLGVLVGSMLWWCVIVAGVSVFRHAIGVRARRWIDRMSGAVLMLCGALELRRAI
ncbi:LysE family translocator [Caulobacter sp. 73W]|uniref:LysE family translocator n=1 Tax=Caulobacter sp. 73W TaxID=3161137 RepID=A0AB39KS48_9CAUL